MRWLLSLNQCTGLLYLNYKSELSMIVGMFEHSHRADAELQFSEWPLASWFMRANLRPAVLVLGTVCWVLNGPLDAERPSEAELLQ